MNKKMKLHGIEITEVKGQILSQRNKAMVTYQIYPHDKGRLIITICLN